jgi:hypothetical protein
MSHPGGESEACGKFHATTMPVNGLLEKPQKSISVLALQSRDDSSNRTNGDWRPVEVPWLSEWKMVPLETTGMPRCRALHVMPKLALIRLSTVHECWDYFEEKTDVWVFGDCEGYQLLAEMLIGAATSSNNRHVEACEQHPTSMRCVILPSPIGNQSRPHLKFFERFAFNKSESFMELVMCGNQAGYRHLSARILELCQKGLGNLDEHFHLDDSTDSCVVKRSVALNFRGPVAEWRREKFDPYEDLVFENQASAFPASLAYRLGDRGSYEEISYKKSEQARF